MTDQRAVEAAFLAMEADIIAFSKHKHDHMPTNERMAQVAVDAALPIITERMTQRLKESDDLLRYALHLRMNGENAPGGKETWREFDRRVNYLLRWHLVAEEGWEQFGTHANDSPMPTLEFSGSVDEDGLPLWERVVKETNDDAKRWQPASDFISRVIQEDGLSSDDTE